MNELQRREWVRNILTKQVEDIDLGNKSIWDMSEDELNQKIMQDISRSIKSQTETYKMIFKEMRYKGFWYNLTDFLGLRSDRSNWCFHQLWGKKIKSDGSITDETYEKLK